MIRAVTTTGFKHSLGISRGYESARPPIHSTQPMKTSDFSGDDHSQGSDNVAIQIDDDADPSELAARVERVVEENRQLHKENEQLRNDYARTRRSWYRQFGLGLTLIGTLSGLSVFVFPDVQNILFAIAATGLFGGLLTYHLSRGRFLAATVCDRIYTAVATNGGVVTNELDLSDDRIYVPSNDGGARLFVPKEYNHQIPDVSDGPVIADGYGHGVILNSTGSELFQEFKRTAAGDFPDEPVELAAQLADAIVEQFELARSVEPTVEHADGHDRVVVTVSDSALGDVDRFDHPIVSFFAVGLAVGLDRPVSLEVTSHGSQTEWIATYQWEASDDA